MKVKNGRGVFCVFITYLVVYFIFNNTELLTFDGVDTFLFFFFSLSAIFAAIMGFFAAKKYTIKSKHGKTLLLLALGVSGLAIGEIISAWFGVFGIEIYPSVADVFFLIAYPLFLIGIINELKGEKLTKCKKSCCIIKFVALILFVITGYYGIYFAYSSGATFLENAVGIAYGVGDAVLLIGIALLIARYGLAFFGKSWVVLSIGFFLTWIADIFYAIYYEAYEAGLGLIVQIDYLWILGYLAMGYFFYRQIKAMDSLLA